MISYLGGYVYSLDKQQTKMYLFSNFSEKYEIKNTNHHKKYESLEKKASDFRVSDTIRTSLSLQFVPTSDILVFWTIYIIQFTVNLNIYCREVSIYNSGGNLTIQAISAYC